MCALRRATGFPLDDLTFVVSHFRAAPEPRARVPHPQGRRAEPLAALRAGPQAAWRVQPYEVGFIHLDVKHLPKLRDRDGITRKRFLYVAIDRATRYVHLAVKDDETTASAVAFLDEAIIALPFQVTHLHSDRGSCPRRAALDNPLEALCPPLRPLEP